MLRPRLRTVTLWTGTTLCVLIAVAFVVSAWWRVSIQFDAMCIIVQDGGVAIQRGGVFSNPVTLERFPGLRHWNRWRFNWPWPAAAPLYAMFAAVAIPTLLVWRFGPKPVKPGHCRCGYMLKCLRCFPGRIVWVVPSVSEPDTLAGTTRSGGGLFEGE